MTQPNRQFLPIAVDWKRSWKYQLSSIPNGKKKEGGWGVGNESKRGRANDTEKEAITRGTISPKYELSSIIRISLSLFLSQP